MKRSFLILAFLILSIASQSTHIVGGNFDLTHISGEKYFIRLIFLFDDINGNKAAKDPYVTISLFDKQTNDRLDSYNLSIKNEEVTKTTSNGCDGYYLIRTRIITYSDTIFLSPKIYNGKDGFYVAFERCCRNFAINNIQNPGGTGMTFYMEQPSPFFGSEQFLNSSPRWKSPTQLYACKDKLLNLDFAATDPDGDSLVYYMEDPTAGHTNPDNISFYYPNSAPYSTVNFLLGYSKNNSINGLPSLNIHSKTGKLSVKPGETGLFVFAVVCEEYRNGKRIGLVKREIQMVVWDCPKIPDPKISGKYNSLSIKELDTLHVYNLKGGCFDIQISDSAFRSFVITLVNVDSIIGNNYTNSLTDGYTSDTLRGSICLPKCLKNVSNAFPIQVIALKNTCDWLNSDTLTFFTKIFDTTSTFNPETAPNIFSPNNDKINDVFIINNIPPDNCDEQYVKFEIYNRWGTQVFSTPDRYIAWEAPNLPDGLYYYYIIFTKQKFKGTIQVLR